MIHKEHNSCMDVAWDNKGLVDHRLGCFVFVVWFVFTECIL
jgi:hypothetical protein